MARRGLHPLSGCACVGVLAGWRVCRRTHPLRPLTRRGCPNGAPQARSEFHGAPRKHPDAGLPLRSAKGSQTVGRVSLPPFLSRTRKEVARRGESRPPHSANTPPVFSGTVLSGPDWARSTRRRRQWQWRSNTKLQLESFLGFEAYGESAGSYCFDSLRCALAECGGRESPGMRVTFFRVAERKSPKKGRPYRLRPCASLRATCGAHVQRGLARTRFTALRSNNREP